MGVPAGYDEADERRLELRIRQIVGGDVRGDVVHAHERQPLGKRVCLGERQPDQQRADEPRPVRDRNAVKPLAIGHARVGQGAVDDMADHLDMAARGDLRHDAAEALVQRDLRVYNI